MHWQRVTNSPRRPAGHSLSRRVRYRPAIDVLEDRTVLSPTAFTVNPTLSSLTLSGSLNSPFGSSTLMEQGPGSLTTTYGGTITADFDLNADTINFLGASTTLNANISGNWQPLPGGGSGSAPADYGSQFQLLGTNYAALRNLVNSISTSSPLPLTPGGGGSYSYPSTQTLAITGGNLDYNTVAFGSGTTTVSGSGMNMAADGTLQDNGDGTYTLTAPIHTTIVSDLGQGVTVTLNVDGTLAGTSSASTSPFHEFPTLTGGAGPTGIAAGSDGNLWFVEGAAGQIGYITPAGSVTEFSVPNVAGGTAIAAGPDGNLWFTEPNANQIGVIGTDGTLTEFAIPTAGAGPAGIAAGPDGNMWFTEQAAGQIGVITTDGSGTVTEFALPTAGAAPTGIAAGPDGNMWFTEQAAGQIGVITTDGNGTVTEFALPTAGAAPTCIAAGPDGNMWFTEQAANQIGVITTDGNGTVTEFGIPTAGASPAGITAGPDGNLWFTELGASQIAQITTDGNGTVTEFATPTAGSGPYGITTGSDGNLWFTEQAASQIGQYVFGAGPLASNRSSSASSNPVSPVGLGSTAGTSLSGGSVAQGNDGVSARLSGTAAAFDQLAGSSTLGQRDVDQYLSTLGQTVDADASVWGWQGDPFQVS